jgi:hypothetical protein
LVSIKKPPVIQRAFQAEKTIPVRPFFAGANRIVASQTEKQKEPFSSKAEWFFPLPTIGSGSDPEAG